MGARFAEEESRWKRREREEERANEAAGVENVGESKRLEERRRDARGKERRERIRQAGRKGMARNILASPRAPSCVLNHFPVDSAVCNPIIGVSPPGKLLFYSRTTRAPDVLSPSLSCTAIFPSLSSDTASSFRLFSLARSARFREHARVSTSPTTVPFFFLDRLSTSYAQFCAPVRLFRSIRPLSP